MYRWNPNMIYTDFILLPGHRTFLCDLPFPARTTELGYSGCLFSSSWALLLSLSLAFILCPSGSSSLFIYWLFSMEKHLVFPHWQQIRAMSLPITLHWVSSLPVKLLAGFNCTWLSSMFEKSDCGLLFFSSY